jgi:hypothetical protein
LLATLAVAILGPQPVLAQEADIHALAVQLFDEAGRAQDLRAFDEACPKFARVVELEPAKLGAKLALAACYEQAGKLASAVTAYRAAAYRAAESGDARQKLAYDKAAELDAKAPHVTLDLSETLRSLPELSVAIDGVPLDASRWSLPVSLDPGDRAVSVGAAGKKAWSRTLHLEAGSSTQIVLVGLEDISPPAPARPAGLTVPAPPRGIPPWVWAAGGLGLASGAVAVGFGVDQAATQRDFNAHCKTLQRDEVGCSERSSRIYRDFGAWIGLGVAGAGGILAAAVGIATSTRRSQPVGARARASFWVAPYGAGAALLGRF